MDDKGSLKLHEMVRDAGRQLFVATAQSHRRTADELLAAQRQAERVVLAAVEALELLADTVQGLASALPDAPRGVLDVAVNQAWQALAGSGVELDGTPGEPLDPKKHRVVKSLAPDGRLPNRVASVWRPGLCLGSTRIRKVEVVADNSGEY